MSNTEHSGGAAHRSFRCTFGPVREVDLVWPPPQEDVDAFTVVRLDGGDAEPAPVEARAEEPVVPEPIRIKPRRIKTTFGDCRPLGAAPRVRPLVVPMEPPPSAEPALPDTPAAPAAAVAAAGPLQSADTAPNDTTPVAIPTGAFSEDPRVAAAEVPPPLLLPRSTARPADADTTGTRSVWLAVFFAAACAAVMFVEGPAPTHSDAVEAPPTPPDITVAVTPAPAPAPPKPAAERPRPAAGPTVVAEAKPLLPERAPKPAAAPAPRSEPPARLAVATPRRALEPPPPVTPRVSVDVHDRGAVPAPAPTPPIATSAPVPSPAPPPALAAARPEPLASAPASSPVAAVLRDTANDEDDIRSTLTRFRTAYSKLDASAARDVWPSVDARALERAFQSLKSQDLHFDSCTMTVTGARAQAACKGRMVYVPRIGDQSPRFASREWNFELRKADERWTIASARSL